MANADSSATQCTAVFVFCEMCATAHRQCTVSIRPSRDRVPLTLRAVPDVDIFVISESCSIKPQQLAASSSYASAKPKSTMMWGTFF